MQIFKKISVFKDKYKENNLYFTDNKHISGISCLQQLFAFDFKEDYGINGWTVYDHEAEFKRQVCINTSKDYFIYADSICLTDK
jgi:hypothetical protein